MGVSVLRLRGPRRSSLRTDHRGLSPLRLNAISFACAARRGGTQSRRTTGAALGWRSVSVAGSASRPRRRAWASDRFGAPCRAARANPALQADRRRQFHSPSGAPAGRRSFEQAVGVRRPLNAHPLHRSASQLDSNLLRNRLHRRLADRGNGAVLRNCRA